MGQPLFDDGDDVDDISAVEIDEAFARRFEHNKRREDLHRLEELKKKGEIFDSSEDDSTSDEEEEEDEEGVVRKTDVQFYDAIVRVKRNDPAIYQKDAKLYSSEEDEEEGRKTKKKKKKEKEKEKPMYIKDVVAKHLLEEGPEYGDETASNVEGHRSKSYFEEQEENKRAFLEAAGSDLGSDGEDLLKEKKRSPEETGDEGEEVIQKKLEEVFGEDEGLDENEAFLKNFFLNKMWLDGEKSKGPVDEDLMAVSEEEDELERQDKYEAEFNFRYQEGAGDRVLGHSRVIEGTVRKKTNSRKAQRKSKEERMSQVELERREELKRLKNIKKKEIQEKLEKVRKIAGIAEGGDCALNEDDLEEEFDPEEYDRKMKKVFDAEYYGAEDEGFESGGEEDLIKPDFDQEDELLGLPKEWMNSSSSDGFLAARQKVLNSKESDPVPKIDEDEDEDGEDEAEEDAQKESKRKRKRKISLREKIELEKALEEYYKLDYEGTVGDLKTRFKYKSVPANRFGLSSEEILLAEDKELNQYVSLKKIAPYREEEWKPSRQRRFHQKKLLQEKKWDAKKKDEDNNNNYNNKKKKSKRDGHEIKESEKESESVECKEEQSRRIKRRKRQKELKLSQSRLMAYGKIPPKSKN
ncbi:KRR1 family protein [Wolffia australiana]